MSAAIHTVRRIDSRLDFSTPPSYSVVAGARSHTFQAVSASSASNSSINFNAVIPSQSTVVSRRIVFQSTVQLAINCTGATTGQALLALGSCDAPSSFPVHRVMNTLTLVAG